MKILEIKNLNVSFAGGVQAVKNLSLTIDEGSFTALVGESGSGKSVTALSVTRLLRPESLQGSIHFHGKEAVVDLLSLPENQLRSLRGREIAYVFQDPGSSLNPVLSIRRQLVDVISIHDGFSGEKAALKAGKALSDVRLADPARILSSYPHELSGGMKQRVLIAMALLGRPKLLIADEPTTALDVSTETEIMSLLTGLQKLKGLTILFITHNLPLAMRHSDAVCVMREGQLVERFVRGGSPGQAYSKKLFSASLIGVEPKTRIGV